MIACLGLRLQLHRAHGQAGDEGGQLILQQFKMEGEVHDERIKSLNYSQGYIKCIILVVGERGVEAKNKKEENKGA